MKNKQLISTIWNFNTSEDSTYLTHGIYRWYGKLVPQLVAKTLDQYTEPGDSIIANFSGSGTIALEAMIRNVNCIGTDINPLAILISKVKTTKIMINDINSLIDEIILEAKDKEKNISISHLYQPEKWYNEKDAQKLVALKNIIDKTDDVNIKNYLLVTLANITRDCSNIDSRCVNHIVVDKNKKTKDVYESFKASALNIYNSIQELNKYKSSSKISFIKHSADDMSYAKNESIDLVFSHPPYLNAVNYYNIYRLSTDLLELNYDKIRSEDFSAKKLNVFLDFMEKTFRESYRVLKKGKRCIVVIGDTRFHGNLITLGVDFINLLKKVGFEIEDIHIWEQNRKAGMNVARRGNYIDHNYVIVAKKED